MDFSQILPNYFLSLGPYLIGCCHGFKGQGHGKHFPKIIFDLIWMCYFGFWNEVKRSKDKITGMVKGGICVHVCMYVYDVYCIKFCLYYSVVSLICHR